LAKQLIKLASGEMTKSKVDIFINSDLRLPVCCNLDYYQPRPPANNLIQHGSLQNLLYLLASFCPLLKKTGASVYWLLFSVWMVFLNQRAKKVVSDSPGLVGFAIGLVNSVFNLPDGQVMFFEEFV